MLSVYFCKGCGVFCSMRMAMVVVVVMVMMIRHSICLCRVQYVSLCILYRVTNSCGVLWKHEVRKEYQVL